MKEIVLARGQKAIVDDIDYERLNSGLWYFKEGYAARSSPPGTEFLHHLVIYCPIGYEVDHMDGNKLNNTRGNLRAVAHNQNMYNMTKRYDNKSGYRGVCWHKQHGKWYAVVNWTHEGEKKRMGKLFKDPKEAALWWNDRAKEVYGHNFRPNEV